MALAPTLVNREYWWKQEVFPQEYKWTSPLDLQIFSLPTLIIVSSYSITHNAPSILLLMVLLCKVFLIGLFSKASVVGDLARTMKRVGRVFSLLLFNKVLIPALFLLPIKSLNGTTTTTQMEVCTLFVSLYQGTTGAAPACLIWQTHRQLLHTHIHTQCRDCQAIFYDPAS